MFWCLFIFGEKLGFNFFLFGNHAMQHLLPSPRSLLVITYEHMVMACLLIWLNSNFNLLVRKFGLTKISYSRPNYCVWLYCVADWDNCSCYQQLYFSKHFHHIILLITVTLHYWVGLQLLDCYSCNVWGCRRFLSSIESHVASTESCGDELESNWRIWKIKCK